MQLRRSLIATGMVAALAVAGVTAAVANDPPPRIAFLANGIVPADALAAGPIAGQLGAPIYTTGPGALIDSTASALDAYDPDLVIVMGGPAAISDTVLAQVSDVTDLSVEEPSPPPTSGIVRAAGADRFETAAAAAALLGAYDPAFLPTDGKATAAGHADTAGDADTLDGQDSTAFAAASAAPAAMAYVAHGSLTRGFGFTSVTSPVSGVYCLTLDPTLGLTAGDVIAQVSVEWGASTGLGLFAYWQGSVIRECSNDEVEVRTYQLVDGDPNDVELSSGVAFTVVAHRAGGASASGLEATRSTGPANATP